jgi:hypothetical protein
LHDLFQGRTQTSMIVRHTLRIIIERNHTCRPARAHTHTHTHTHHAHIMHINKTKNPKT